MKQTEQVATKEFLAVLVMGAVIGWMAGMFFGANLRQMGLEDKCTHKGGFWADDDVGVRFKCERVEWKP